LRIPAFQLNRGLKIGYALYEGIVVSEATRQQLQEAGLAGPKFNELAPSGHAATGGPGRFYELTSSVILPAMARDRLKPHKKTPEDYEHVAGLLDGEFFDKEIHYAESGIRAIEPFDFA